MRSMPPGRTARLWLRRRLDVASRGIDVLEQKTHALAREQRRLSHHVEDTRSAWHNAARDANRWFVRATVVGGSQQLELAHSQQPAAADVRVSWQGLMGVAHPAQARLEPSERAPLGSVARSSALAYASDAYRRAVAAALDHAAATRALELVEGELAVTRRRLRALENRWVPRLEQLLHDVELSLAENEREDMVRTRWVAGNDHGGGGE